MSERIKTYFDYFGACCLGFATGYIWGWVGLFLGVGLFLTIKIRR